MPKNSFTLLGLDKGIFFLLFKANTPFSNIQFVLFNRFSANTWKLFRVKFVFLFSFVSKLSASLCDMNTMRRNMESDKSYLPDRELLATAIVWPIPRGVSCISEMYQPK
jgi:hypothetical protein